LTQFHQGCPRGKLGEKRGLHSLEPLDNPLFTFFGEPILIVENKPNWIRRFFSGRVYRENRRAAVRYAEVAGRQSGSPGWPPRANRRAVLHAVVLHSRSLLGLVQFVFDDPDELAFGLCAGE